MSDNGGRAALDAVIESARHLGVEIDEAEAAQWVTALEAEESGVGDVVVDVDSGIYGHRVSMLDFSSRDLARFRAIGEIVGFPDRPPTVLTALALSGSAAQGKVQSYPGDCDYFERIHISAPTRAAACAILADVIREKALATRVGPTLPPLGGEVRQLPVRRGARRPAGARRDARSRGRPTRSPPAASRWSATARPRRSPGTRPPPSPAGASWTGSWRTRCDVPSRTPATCSTSRGRRPTARSSPSTASSTPTSRRSTSRRSRSRSSPGW